MAVTPESRNSVAPQTSLEIGGGRTRGRSKKSRKKSLSKSVGRKSEQTGKDERRKRRRGKAPSSKRSRSKESRKEEINQALSLDAGSGMQADQNLQTLFMSFRSLKYRQVKKLGHKDALEIYRELKDGDPNWATVMGNDSPNNMMSVCRRHEKNSRIFSSQRKNYAT